MAALLVVSESGRPPDDSPLARSVAEADDPDLVVVDARDDVVATLMADSSSRLRRDAAQVVFDAFGADPELDALYGDSAAGDRSILRPAWSPIRVLTHPTDLDHVVLRGQHATGTLADRILAITSASRVGHVPAPLVAVPAEAAPLDDAAAAAVHRAAAGRSLALEPCRPDRFRAAPVAATGVSVVIPTAATAGGDGRPLVEAAIAACLATRADELDVLLVVGDECRVDPDELAIDPRVRIVRRPPGDWSFSAAVNLGILAATQPTVLVLNDDVELLDADWLQRMASHLRDPTVGAVGALLLYPDLTCQHVGMVTDDAVPLHPFVGRTIADLEALDADLAHDRIAVTAACLLARRADLLAVGAFSEALPFGFNDVDLCYKLHRAGLRVVVEPAARMIHHESASRPPITHAWEWDRFVGRWGDVVDPWYHPAYHRPDDPDDRRRNADHLPPTSPHRDHRPRSTTLRSRVHHARVEAAESADPAR